MARTNNGLLVFILAVGVFGILNTEMGVVGIIPQVSEHFSVSIPTAGWLVSGFALVVALAGPTMPLLFSKMNRKTVMLLALGVFSLCNMAAIVAPTFECLMVTRIAPAAFHPLYVSMALAVAAQTGRTEAESAQASSRVFVGVSAGMVLGVPIASFLASVAMLQASLSFFAVVTIAVFIATIFLVPSLPVEKGMTYGRQIAILKKPVLWASLFVTIFLNGAMFGFYSYMADYFGVVSHMGAFAVSAALLIYGAMNIVGNVVSGHALAKNPRLTIVLAPCVLVVLYAVLFAVGACEVATFITIFVLGIVAGVVNNANQFLVARSAPEASDFSNGLYLTAANLGTTVATALCGAFITLLGTHFSLMGSLIFLVLGIACVVWRIAVVPNNHA